LLAAAESAGFDLLITTDKGIRYQQDWSERKLSLLVLSTNDWTRIRRCKTIVVDAVAALQGGSQIEVEIPLAQSF
jgi:hypothetical protein